MLLLVIVWTVLVTVVNVVDWLELKVFVIVLLDCSTNCCVTAAFLTFPTILIGASKGLLLGRLGTPPLILGTTLNGMLTRLL